ncbi:methylthioribose-1-phosphate isomerase [Blumeria hordei DH14]|uniref:Methylthioribose-1-phosphate isomerase n=1 Tax=Blumeria graminis f. sp. hordei (strain DH14) TaxID=546991 RepID=N1JE06_BLUG1|nr:methylthioribose-1-phosphate isomerase [Blumeria hordei DH14]
MASLEAIKYRRGKLDILDQKLLPHQISYHNVISCVDAFECITSMRVRGKPIQRFFLTSSTLGAEILCLGAPAIAIVAALSLAVEMEQKRDGATTPELLVRYVNAQLDYLLGSRPTAVDLSNAIRLLKSSVAYIPMRKNPEYACAEIRKALINTAEKILEDDLTTNLAIGRYGAEYLRRQQIPVYTSMKDVDQLRYFTTSPPGTQGAPDQTYKKISVLTHCNTGSLATSGHGTALGIIRSLFKMSYLNHAYYTETRPYNQGSRLTAFELFFESIPSTLICDSMAASLFARYKDDQNIAAVIVGADRVARNGDTANKIGTYALAILARHHGIKFIVAAPTTSIDLRTETGAEIRIENRCHTELTQISGALVDLSGKIDQNRSARVAIADQRVNVWNPAFDITPAFLIDAIITERGEVLRNSSNKFDFRRILNDRWVREVRDTIDEEFVVSSDDSTQFPMEV